MNAGRRTGLAAATLLLTIGAVPGSGHVVDVTATGFEVRHEVSVHVDPTATWRTLLDVGAWWNPAHTYSGKAGNLHLDARPGGCFCERLPHRGGVEHLRVVFVAPPSTLRLSGALGPLQSSGLAGSLAFTVAAQPDGRTRIGLVYGVGGYLAGGFESLAPAVDAMLGEQLERLRARLEPRP